MIGLTSVSMYAWARQVFMNNFQVFVSTYNMLHKLLIETKSTPAKKLWKFWNGPL